MLERMKLQPGGCEALWNQGLWLWLIQQSFLVGVLSRLFQIFGPQAVFWGASVSAVTRSARGGSTTTNSPLHLSINFYLLDDSHCSFWGTKSTSALCVLCSPPTLPVESSPSHSGVVPQLGMWHRCHTGAEAAGGGSCSAFF